MMLPSYRERVCQVRFARGEGGLNLAMKPAMIASIMGKAGARGRSSASTSISKTIAGCACAC